MFLNPNFKSSSRSLEEQFIFTEGQNNFGNKIQFQTSEDDLTNSISF